MKKAGSNSYSNFRKNNSSLGSDRKIAGELSEIDDLARQLENYGTNKKVEIEGKYRSFNAIIEAEDEESPKLRLPKKKEGNNLFDGKRQPNKIAKYEVPLPKKSSQPVTKTNNNKSANVSVSSKRIPREEEPKNVARIDVRLKNNKNMSFDNQEMQQSLLSTSSSFIIPKLNWSSEAEKRSITLLVQRISQKMAHTDIPMGIMEEILEKLNNVDSLLDKY